MRSLSNISLREFRALLSSLGLERRRTKGGHEAWRRDGMTRSVIFQTHEDPVPEFVVRNALRNLGLSRDEFVRMLENM